ncbi:hypothetical protein ACJX0J_038872, partial [Zea mays]
LSRSVAPVLNSGCIIEAVESSPAYAKTAAVSGIITIRGMPAVLLEVKYFWAHQTLQIRPHFKL